MGDTLVDRANGLLDSLPRPFLTRGGRRVSTFQVCGVTGFYAAVGVLVLEGLVVGLSLAVLSLLAVSSGLAFFGYTWLRRAVTGAEELVLLEHVWFALGVDALVVVALGEPVLTYLAPVTVALCPFLAAGRLGCLLVGCCHGQPAGFGLRYGPEVGRAGLPEALVGVRLLPVPLLELAGLLVIGGVGAVLGSVEGPRAGFAWFVVAYAVLRFGLEGLRGDPRPHLVGLSVARWICVVQVVVAIAVLSWPLRAQQVAVAAALSTLVVAATLVRRSWDPRRRLLAPAHVEELWTAARGMTLHDGEVAFAVTRLGASLAASPGELPGTVRVSLSLGEGRVDAAVLCRLACAALPGVRPESGLLAGEVLHLLLDRAYADPSRPAAVLTERAAVAESLYGHVLRRLQAPAARPVRAVGAGP